MIMNTYSLSQSSFSSFICKIPRIPRRIIRELRTLGEFFYFRFFYKTQVITGPYEFKRLLIGGGEPLDELAKAFREIFSDKVVEKIKEADLTCEHVFDLLGSSPKKLSKEGKGYQPIDWHSDFKKGYRWDPKTFFRYTRYGHIEGVDVKVPWELSRFQHLNILGQAYVLTKDRKYADEFVNQINDWVDHNPVGFGVNWHCAMDIAIRAANWLVAQEFFQDIEDKGFWNKFYKSIYNHGLFIRKHLEIADGFTNNHYLSDLAGLLFIGSYCPFLKESLEWIKFSIDELTKEIDIQVYEDGCNFEASTCYHRLALEILFYSELLAERQGRPFPTKFKEKVRKMFGFSLYCIKPNGMIPQIGDNDNGRFLTFCRRPVLENKYLLTIATAYYNDSNFKLPQFEFDEETFWLFGIKGKAVFDNIPVRPEPLKSKAFENAGWYIMRHKDDYCFIICGPNGQNGRGGHAHNDKLSFELMMGGQDIIVDPGTYVYTANPEWRNRFRSTGYHNTITTNDIEQNPLNKNLFSLKCGTKIQSATLEENSDQIVFRASIRLRDAFSLSREIKYDKNQDSFSICDSFNNKKRVTLTSQFHLDSELEVRDSAIVARGTGKKVARIEFANKSAQTKPYDYSAAYGEKRSAVSLELNAENSAEISAKIIKERS